MDFKGLQLVLRTAGIEPCEKHHIILTLPPAKARGECQPINKGYTASQTLQEFKRLSSAGIDYGANVILGITGSGYWAENVRATPRSTCAA